MPENLRPSFEELKKSYASLLTAYEKGLLSRGELLSQQAAEAETHAAIDPLTGLKRREIVVGDIFSMARALRRPLAENPFYTKKGGIALIDLDNFKQKNDEFGHDAGDQILKKSAEILRQSVRPEDHIGRYGGEELILGLVETTERQGLEIVERIRRKFDETQVTVQLPFPGREIQLSQTVSIGFMPIPPHVTLSTLEEVNLEVTISNLISSADQALNFAKGKGKNRIGIFLARPFNKPRIAKVSFTEEGSHFTYED